MLFLVNVLNYCVIGVCVCDVAMHAIWHSTIYDNWLDLQCIFRFFSWQCVEVPIGLPWLARWWQHGHRTLNTWASPIGTFVKHLANMSWVPRGHPMWDPQSSRQRTQLLPSSGHRKLTQKGGQHTWIQNGSTFSPHTGKPNWNFLWNTWPQWAGSNVGSPRGTNKAVHKRPSSPIETFVKHVAKMSWVPCGDPMLDPQTVHKGPS